MDTVCQPFGFKDLVTKLVFLLPLRVSFLKNLLDSIVHREIRTSHDISISWVGDLFPITEDSVDSEIRQSSSENYVWLEYANEKKLSRVCPCFSVKQFVILLLFFEVRLIKTAITKRNSKIRNQNIFIAKFPPKECRIHYTVLYYFYYCVFR